MFQEKKLCDDGAYATWAEQLREGDQQVDGEDKEFAHGRERYYDRHLVPFYSAIHNCDFTTPQPTRSVFRSPQTVRSERQTRFAKDSGAR